MLCKLGQKILLETLVTCHWKLELNKYLCNWFVTHLLHWTINKGAKVLVLKNHCLPREREERQVRTNIYCLPTTGQLLCYRSFISFNTNNSFGQKVSESPLNSWKTEIKEIKRPSSQAELGLGLDPNPVHFPSGHSVTLRKAKISLYKGLTFVFIKQKTSTFSSHQPVFHKLDCSSELSEEHLKHIWAPQPEALIQKVWGRHFYF